MIFTMFHNDPDAVYTDSKGKKNGRWTLSSVGDKKNLEKVFEKLIKFMFT